MKVKKDWITPTMDRTFCIHDDCKVKTCSNHQCHKIPNYPYPYSVADFRGKKDYCELECDTE